jgi:hypothetical protein
LAQAANRPTNWLVEGVLVAGHPTFVAADVKCLKTSICIDLAISLATAQPFLGRFRVPAAVNVGFFSGEGGEVTLANSSLRISRSKGIDFGADCGRLTWSDELPNFRSDSDLLGIEDFITNDRLQVLVIDPLYLCMNIENEAANLFAVGLLLHRIGRLCQEHGVTLILVHHNSGDDRQRSNKPPRFQDMAYAGFKQFAGQWISLGRRSPYKHDGRHELHLVLGRRGSGSALCALDIDEGLVGDNLTRWCPVIVKRDRATKADGAAPKSKDTVNEKVDSIVGFITAGGLPKDKADVKARFTTWSGSTFENAWKKAVEGERIHAQADETYWVTPAWVVPPGDDQVNSREDN